MQLGARAFGLGLGHVAYDLVVHSEHRIQSRAFGAQHRSRHQIATQRLDRVLHEFAPVEMLSAARAQIRERLVAGDRARRVVHDRAPRRQEAGYRRAVVSGHKFERPSPRGAPADSGAERALARVPQRLDRRVQRAPCRDNRRQIKPRKVEPIRARHRGKCARPALISEGELAHFADLALRLVYGVVRHAEHCRGRYLVWIAAAPEYVDRGIVARGPRRRARLDAAEVLHGKQIPAARGNGRAHE